MNVSLTAQKAYAQNAAPVSTPRGVEYDAFARVTRHLKSAVSAGSLNKLAPALHDNRRLWTVLAADVADPKNALPADLRARIFYLAEFTEQHSRKVLQNKVTANPLIEINLAVMRGLRQNGGSK